MVIFKPKENKFVGDLKIQLCGKRPHPTESVTLVGNIMLMIFPLN